MAFELQVIDLILVILGSGCLVGFVAWLLRSGRWRDPLAGVATPEQGPTATSALLMVLAFLMVPLAVSSLLMDDVSNGERLQAALPPGSDAWHRVQSMDATAKAVLSLLMVWLLVRTHSFVDPRAPLSPLRGALIGLFGALVVIPVVTVQLKMGTVLWQWIRPDAPPPPHPVLVALETSAWGGWGVVQLLAGAVVIAPLAEELLFRGVVLQALYRHLQQGWVAIACSSVAFGLVHLAQPQAILPLATMGVILGYIRLRSGSLWPCIIVHYLFNARTMTLTLLGGEVLQQG